MSTLVDDEETIAQSQNDQRDTAPSKTRMSKRKYKLMMTYESKELAEKAIEKEFIWS